MENQHRHITGYRELDENDIAEMNAVKDLIRATRAGLDSLRQAGERHDQRCVSVAITKLEECSMWAVRAIARPEE